MLDRHEMHLTIKAEQSMTADDIAAVLGRTTEEQHAWLLNALKRHNDE